MKLCVNTFIIAMSLPCAVIASRIELTPIVVPEFLDTEVSTNFAFNTSLNLREIQIAFHLEDCSSNCIQVAFGVDDNENHVLDFDETETVFGWCNGSLFIDDAVYGERIYEYATLYRKLASL